MISYPLGILIIVLCIIAEGFFSGSEIAIVSVDKLKLRHQANKGDRAARLVVNMLKRPEGILGTTLLGTNIATITSTTISAALFYRWLGPVGIIPSIAVMAFLNWIFAEIVPKSIFQQLSDTLTPRIIYLLRFFYFLFFPIVWLFSNTAGLLTRLIGRRQLATHRNLISKEEIKLLMSMKHSKSDVKPGEKRMISRLLSFSETKVDDIMVPLSNVAALSDKATVADAIARYVKTKHRRLPVYSQRIDRIIGILNSFDIMAEDGRKGIKHFVRPAYYIPANMGVADLLEQMQKNGVNMAIVVDEFGGAEGIVAIEDILEVIVGDIEDEYDHARPAYVVLNDGAIVVNAQMEVEEVNERFNLNIPPGDYETLGGFFINRFQRIPKAGEKIKLADTILSVYRASQRMIVEIKINKIKPDANPETRA